MKSVWKYPLTAEDNIVLALPLGVEPLCVQIQHDEPQLWCLVDPQESACTPREFRHAGTGHPIAENNLKYIGSYQLFGGGFVGHLFEVVRR